MLKEKTEWADAGYAVAMGQLKTGVRETDVVAKAEKAEGRITVSETLAALILTGADFEYRFSKRSGDFYSIRKNGREYLKEPVPAISGEPAPTMTGEASRAGSPRCGGMRARRRPNG